MDPAKALPSPDELPRRQRVILAHLRERAARRLGPPSLREIQDACGISSSSVVHYNLDHLEQAGLIELTPGKARGVRLILRRGDPCPCCGRPLEEGPS